MYRFSSTILLLTKKERNIVTIYMRGDFIKSYQKLTEAKSTMVTCAKDQFLIVPLEKHSAVLSTNLRL